MCVTQVLPAVSRFLIATVCLVTTVFGSHNCENTIQKKKTKQKIQTLTCFKMKTCNVKIYLMYNIQEGILSKIDL